MNHNRVDGHHVTIEARDTFLTQPQVVVTCECGSLTERARAFDLHHLNLIVQNHHQVVRNKAMLDSILAYSYPTTVIPV
jgi:hypothetical protein